LEFVNNERRIERANCEESKDRIVAGCYDAK